MLQHIAIERIQGDDRNVRAVKATPEQEASLIASIKAIGLLSPIHVTPIDDHLFRVVAGNRRFAACAALGWRELPCLMVQPSTDLTLIQTTENLVRADLHPLDVWLAVERMVTTGMTVPAVALALNMTEKRVGHLLAMSRMHPKIVASIRKHPHNMPEERLVRIICQASHEKQEAAFAKQGPIWWRLAAALIAKGMKRSEVRFDITKYTGEIHRDLFDEDTDELLTDFDQALRLQDQWVQGELEFRISQGWKAAALQHDQWGNMKVPAGAKRDKWELKSVKHKVKKADRGNWIYAAGVDGSGAVIEYLFPVAPTAEAKAVAAAETAAVASPATKKGEQLIEQLQREALANHIETMCEDDTLMLAAALCILEHGNDGPSEQLFEKGQLRQQLTIHTIRATLAHAVGGHLRRWGMSAPVTMPIVSRLGDYTGTVPTMPPIPDNLAMLKRPGLQSVLAALGKRLDDFSSQGQARDYIAKEMGAADRDILPAELPGLGYDTSKKLGYIWTRAEMGGQLPDDDEGEEGEDDGGEADAPQEEAA